MELSKCIHNGQGLVVVVVIVTTTRRSFVPVLEIATHYEIFAQHIPLGLATSICVGRCLTSVCFVVVIVDIVRLESVEERAFADRTENLLLLARGSAARFELCVDVLLLVVANIEKLDDSSARGDFA